MVADGAEGRFRPIPLASLTAFSGFTPLTLQRATQERFLVGSASVLVIGIMTATGAADLTGADPGSVMSLGVDLLVLSVAVPELFL